jgi:hypothetical protein
MADEGKDEIRDWSHTLIERSRDATIRTPHPIDLSSPCQVEVFWISGPLEAQAFIITHDRDRDDKEIRIHGPHSGYDFVEEIAEVAEEDRWQEPLPNYKNIPGRGPPTKADVLADLISRLTRRLQESVFSDLGSSSFHFWDGKRLWPNAFSHIMIGNVVEYDIGDEFGITDRSDLEENSETEADEETGESQDEEEADEDRRVAGGGYIYEPVWVEAAPERSFEENVWGSENRRFDCVLNTEICGLDLKVMRDGLLYIFSEDGEEIQRILNTFFGVGIFGDFRQWRTIIGREIISSEFSGGELSSSSYEISTPSGRNQLLKPDTRPSDTDRGLITSDQIKQISKIVDTIYPIHNVRERIILHSQAHTHLLDDEFDASFVLNWTVTEQLIDDLLKRNIDKEYELDWEDKQLEFASIADIITESEYDILDEYRERRNDIVHEMESVSVKEAEKLDLIVSKILVRDINHYLDEQGITPISFRPYPIKFNNRTDNETRWELSNL